MDKRSLVALAMTCMPTAPVLAQADNGLSGATPARVVVETLDDDAKQCGITSDALDAAVRLPLTGARLLTRPTTYSEAAWAVAQAFGPYLYVNVNVLRLSSGGCFASVTLQFVRPVDFGSKDASKLTYVTAWNKGSVMSGGPSEFGLRVANMVESYAKQFAAAWLRSN